MSMIEEAFEAKYTGGDYEAAIAFHGDQQFYPVLYAGTVGRSLFYITRGSADFAYDLYLVPWWAVDEYGTQGTADRNGQVEFWGIDALEEAERELGL